VSVFKVKIPQAPTNLEVRVNIPSRNQIQVPDAPRSVWAIGGGKGGIGKTLLTSNMAVYLSWLNKRVVVVDMDLGGSNLHTSLGVEAPQKTLNDLMLGRIEDVSELLQTTPIRNLQLISGSQDAMGLNNLSHTHKTRLARKLAEIPADFILLDLGAGTANNTLDFFLMADRKIVVVTPEPTSIENAYRFIKSAFYRMLRAASPSPHVRQLIEQAMDAKNTRGIRTPKELLSEVKRLSPPDGLDLEQRMRDFQIGLIVNQVRVKAEADIGKSILMVCERYFGMSVQYMGYLPYDSAVWQSIRRRVPFLIDAPNSTAVTHLEGILRSLLKVQGAKP
jgi:flagellar biosynthesis protein FlhG